MGRKFIKNGDPRLLRQAERMHIQEDRSAGSSTDDVRNAQSASVTRNTIPTRNEEDERMEQDNDMEDGSSQAGIGEDEDRMLMSLVPDQEIQKTNKQDMA